ncbi:unnamed protein product, partial [Clonostachys rosea f. rosea IK726]
MSVCPQNEFDICAIHSQLPVDGGKGAAHGFSPDGEIPEAEEPGNVSLLIAAHDTSSAKVDSDKAVLILRAVEYLRREHALWAISFSQDLAASVRYCLISSLIIALQGSKPSGK